MSEWDSHGEPAEEADYCDDPKVDQLVRACNLQKILGGIAAIIAVTFFINTTFAANVSLNSGQTNEFGQGVLQTVACSAGTNLTMTPASTFINSSGAGGMYFSSATVSNIPSSCNGADFTINAFGSTASIPLAIFNGNATSAVVYDNAGTFQIGSGISGATVTSGSGTFTITFTTPVAFSASIYKLTIQSGTHAVSEALVFDNTTSTPQAGVYFNSGITEAEEYQGVAGSTITKVIVNCISDCSALHVDWDFYSVGGSNQPLTSLGVMTTSKQTASQLTFTGAITVPAGGKFYMGWYLYSGSFTLALSGNPVNSVGGSWSQIANLTDWYNFGLGNVPANQEGQNAQVVQIYARP